MIEISIDKDSNSTAYTQMHAQNIIDHFSSAVQNNTCTFVVPMSIYLELDRQQTHITSVASAIVQGNDPYISDEIAYPDGTDSIESNSVYRGQNFTSSQVKDSLAKIQNDCMNCKIDIPKIDFSDFLGMAISDAKALLEQLKNMFKMNRVSMCQFSFFLSYMCIPDLIKLMAMILAAIVKILAMLVITTFSITAFIMGILSKILMSLVANIGMLARFALTPVLCILDAIDSIVDGLPTPENIKKQVPKSDLDAVGLTGYLDGDTGIAAVSKTVRDTYTSTVKDINQNINDMTGQVMSEITDTVQKSIDSLIESINELGGLMTHMQCEGARSGSSVMDHLDGLMKLMALVNLIRSAIEMKSRNAARDALCNRKGGTQSNYSKDDPFLSIQNIGQVIKQATGEDVLISVDSDNKPVALIIKNTDAKPTESLSMWDCSINSFIAESNIQTIIQKQVKIQADLIELDGFEMEDPKIAIVKDRDVDAFDFDYTVVPLKLDTDWYLADHIKSAFDLIDVYNPSTDGTKQLDILQLLPDNVSPEAINEALQNASISYNKKTDYVFGSNSDKKLSDYIKKAKVNNQETAIDNISTGLNPGIKYAGNLPTTGRSSGGNINLQCGSIENISQNLGFLNE